MIPYIEIPSTKLFDFIPIQPFGILVGIALVIGYTMARRRAAEIDLDPDLCADGAVFIIITAFIVSHLIAIFFYYPERIVENPFVILAVWDGLSSFGGWIGGILGTYLFFNRIHRVPTMPYAECYIFGLTPAWIVGRLGCAVVHDHPGAETTFFLAVRCASETCQAPWAPGVVRHDLGLYGMLVWTFVTIVLHATKNYRPFYGFHLALVAFVYTPIRFSLDFLRTVDKRYFGLTPGQFMAISLFTAGFVVVWWGRRQRARGIAPGLTPPAADDADSDDDEGAPPEPAPGSTSAES